MSLKNVLIAAMVAAPIVVWAQTAKQMTPTPKASFDTMQANVAKITDASEKERWQANVAMWQMKMAHTGAWAPADVAKMQPSFDAMKANVAKITETAEKERWQANCDLWQALLAPANPDLDKMKTALGVVTGNVAEITTAGEKTRWQANRNLWQAVVDQK